MITLEYSIPVFATITELLLSWHFQFFVYIVILDYYYIIVYLTFLFHHALVMAIIVIFHSKYFTFLSSSFLPVSGFLIYIIRGNFRGNSVSRIFFSDISGELIFVNCLELRLTKDFRGINFCELGLIKDFTGINFWEINLCKDFAENEFSVCLQENFFHDLSLCF